MTSTIVTFSNFVAEQDDLFAPGDGAGAVAQLTDEQVARRFCNDQSINNYETSTTRTVLVACIC